MPPCPLSQRRFRWSGGVLQALALSAGTVGLACAPPGPPKLPPGLPPTPETVTLKEPGGDAANPQVAALARVLVEPMGPRVDRRDSVIVSLPDPGRWKRVKFKLIPSWTSFRYGDEHHAIATLYVRPPPVPNPTSDQCMADFEKWGRELLANFEGKLTDADTTKVTWNGQSITVRSREGSGSFVFFGTRSYAVTYAAYPIWGGCAVLGYGMPMKESADLARQVRDRFAKEAFQSFVVKATEKPKE